MKELLHASENNLENHYDSAKSDLESTSEATESESESNVCYRCNNPICMCQTCDVCDCVEEGTFIQCSLCPNKVPIKHEVIDHKEDPYCKQHDKWGHMFECYENVIIALL